MSGGNGKPVDYGGDNLDTPSLASSSAKGCRKYGIIGDSPHLMKVRGIIRSISDKGVSVLINGPTGTGKGLVAKAIHQYGNRKLNNLQIINCAGLSENIIERELFGNEKGAYTGAEVRQIGHLEEGDGGTVVLDDITEMGLRLQPKLYQALEEGFFYRVGGTTRIQLNARVIATTMENPDEAIRKGKFTEALKDRLEVIPIFLPPLKDRGGDIRLLAEYFCNEYSKKYNKNLVLGEDAFNLLEAYSWPGNVRELRNVLERAVVLYHEGDPYGQGEQQRLNAKYLHSMLFDQKFTTNGENTSQSLKNSSELGQMLLRYVNNHVIGGELPLETILKSIEKLVVQERLYRLNCAKAITAGSLGVDVKTLYRKLNNGGNQDEESEKADRSPIIDLG